MADQKAWMIELKKIGTYYEGVVKDLDDVLERYKRETVTTWGTRRSSTNASCVSSISFNSCTI